MQRVEMEDADHGTLSVAVAEALAAARGIEPIDLDITLYDYLDPEALDRMYERCDGDGTTWRLEFAADRHHVIVRSDGLVAVD